MSQHLLNAMRSVTMTVGCKSPQLYPVNSTAGGGGGGAATGGAGDKFLQTLQDYLKLNSITPSHHRSQSLSLINNVTSSVLPEGTTITGLPQSDAIEPQIDLCLKLVDIVSSLAGLYDRLENCAQFERSGLYLEQRAIFSGLNDPRLSRRSLKLARKHAVDAHSKVVLSAWLRFERREDEFLGVSAMDCSGLSSECPKCSLVSGYNPESTNDPCPCSKESEVEEDQRCSTSVSHGDDIDEDDYDIWFCIGGEEVKFNRFKIASLSRPFKAMLNGSFMESRRERIYFTQNGISVAAMRAAEIFSRTKRVDSFDPHIVLELLVLSDRFCCDELKSACDAYLASLIDDMDSAVLLFEYGLEESAYLLVAACLQVFLREIPSSMRNPNVNRFFCSAEFRERLAVVGHASFLLYSFLSMAAMEENMTSNTTVMLLERTVECAVENWQKQLVFHQLGCVMLERKEYKDAERWFEAAVNAGHIYSSAGVARAKYKRGHKYKAYKLMNTLISDHAPAGWMYQERSLYESGDDKRMDLNTATEMDPTLSYPYKYRAVSLLEDGRVGAAISEIDKLIGFKISADCLELRCWFLIALEDYEGALRDTRAILMLDPHYMMFHGMLRSEKLVELLSRHVKNYSQADCWMQLYDRWSSVDDVGSLAVVHHMLSNDPRKSLLWFRQSLLLLRLNCYNPAMRSLRMARNHAPSDHERLVYEGWILYDTGYQETALSKAEKSISIHRSFEAYFLKAYILSETTTDTESSFYVVQLLEEALRCPSDGLRKGQALNNLASIYIDVDKLDLAVDCYMNALDIKHTRAHQGLARVYHLRNQRKAAYEEMTKFIEKASHNASAYEKRSEYCDRELAENDLRTATRLDPLRPYPYRYRAAVLMDDRKEAAAIEEVSRAVAFKLDLQLLHLRAAFRDSMGEYTAAIRDCEAALCLDPDHVHTLELYRRVKEKSEELQQQRAV
ncbi:ethylene-overproduction protein 1 isoform X2 [Andrographis paniculata]|uniref:ethylene-overproduction protein 1 isoform X2 n=1 Tax=Andrographis paniculata TaxID=175694 RepID=UPI0021E6DEF2|nr:ethylene-overproduction protein 1 isoform X2 [Andrographis paniculata]